MIWIQVRPPELDSLDGKYVEPVGVREGEMVHVGHVRQQMGTISKYQAQVRIEASPHAWVHLQDFHYRMAHVSDTNDMLLFCYYLCSCVCSRHSDPIMTNSGVTLATDWNALINKSVLTVDSDPLWCLWWYSSTSHCWCGTRWHGCCTCRLQRTEKGGGWGGGQECSRPSHIRVPRHAVSWPLTSNLFTDILCWENLRINQVLK